MIGERFGKLVVVSYEGKNKQYNKLWKCVCDCGNEKVIEQRHITSGETKSCGCYRKQRLSEITGTHRLSRTPEYIVWSNMRKRCFDPKHNRYHRYGAKGITVCEAWKNSFEAFLLDMGTKPYPEAQIDRIDNNGNYEPSNCSWVNPTSNSRNRSTNTMISYLGETMCIAEWANRLGIKQQTLANRITKLKWPLEKAFTYGIQL